MHFRKVGWTNSGNWLDNVWPNLERRKDSMSNGRKNSQKHSWMCPDLSTEAENLLGAWDSVLAQGDSEDGANSSTGQSKHTDIDNVDRDGSSHKKWHCFDDMF